MASCALLDDRDATAQRPSSRLYNGLVCEHRCMDPAQLDGTCASVDADLRAGLHAVLLADREWGSKLLRAGQERAAAERSLGLADLLRAEALVVCNALRGALPAALKRQAADIHQ
jgi:para-aminobenzoate synthetase/4-amino-4-deoxychorismate lyase